MPNIATVLKGEIARLSRKETRIHTEALAKASRAYRSDIAALKRRVQSLEQLVKKLAKAGGRAAAADAAADDEDGAGLRFSAKGLASHRKRLGLSAAELGKLVGASGNSVYNWEQGSARPRARHIAAIAAVRRMGKREAQAKLAELG